MNPPIVFYYSNRDNGNSASVIANIKKYNINNLLSVCVDSENCIIDNNKRYAMLNRDTKICVPSALKQTPALYVTSENKIIFGSQIMGYLSNMIEMMKNQATNNNGEPEAFFDGFSNFSNGFSDSYAMISQQGQHIVESMDSGHFVDSNHNNVMTVNASSVDSQSVSNNKMTASEINKRTSELSRPINIENRSSMSVDQFKEYNTNLTKEKAMPQYNQMMQKINQMGNSYQPMSVSKGAMNLNDYNNYKTMDSNNYAQNYIKNHNMSTNYNANEFQVPQNNNMQYQQQNQQQNMRYNPMSQQHQQQWESQKNPQYQQYKQQYENQMPVQRQSPMMQQNVGQYQNHRGQEYQGINNGQYYQQRMNQYQSQYGR